MPQVHRGVTLPPNQAELRTVRHGRMYVVAIGINRYKTWLPLGNAVRDAQETLRAFERLGFEPRMPPLLDEAATREVLQRLVTHDLTTLHEDDSLVLFFAGHGHTVTRHIGGVRDATGYVIPIDAEDPYAGGAHTWLRIDTWLSDVARLPPRHILVILDACHSGLALPPMTRYRGQARLWPEQVERLRRRRSRRVITSAQDDEQAIDNGPVPGHSLFTGFLLKALAGQMEGITGFATATDIGAYVHRQVSTFPTSKQSPGIGALEYDDCGELVVELPGAHLPEAIHRLAAAPGPAPGPDRGPLPVGVTPLVPPLPPRASTALSRALDRHHAERAGGVRVFSVLAGHPAAASGGWGSWAGDHGWLTLATEAASPDAAIAELLEQIPWLRCLPAARRLVAQAARIELASVEAELDARSERERAAWFEELACQDPRAAICGWLIATLRRPQLEVPESVRLPAPPATMLATLAELAPITVLLQHGAPTADWLTGAIETAAELSDLMPSLPVAVTAPSALARQVLRGQESDAFSMARQSTLGVGDRSLEPSLGAQADAGFAALCHALATDPRTARRFERNVNMPIHEQQRDTQVELVARAARLVVQRDTWYRAADPQRLQRDHLQDRWLQHAGFFVQRFVADDLEQRLDDVVEEIASGVAGRSELDSLFPET